MGKELKILLLEDSLEDVGLIQRELNRAGITAEYIVANTRAEFEEALNESHPDIILSDHSMPSFNSFEALEIFQKVGLKIPFILVTGSVSEEFAVQCIKAGADDYILKDRLKRLPDSVRGALERRKIEDEREVYLNKVIASEAHMREVERLASFGTWKFDLKSGKAEWSDGFYNLRGYQPGEIKPSVQSFYKHIHSDDLAKVKNKLEFVSQHGATQESEYRILTKEGKTRYVHSRITVLDNEPSNVLVGFSIDITDRKLAESLLQEAYQIARIGGWEIDLINSKLTWTDVTREIHEVERDFEPEIASAIQFYKEGKSRRTIQLAVKAAIEKGESWDMELQIITAKGKERWVRAIGKAEMQGKKCVRVYGSFQDIHELKQAQIELEKQNKKLRQIAWTQSHEVRAPIARMMGLINLLQRQEDDPVNTYELIDKVITSAHELDAIVKKIVRWTEEVEPPEQMK